MTCEFGVTYSRSDDFHSSGKLNAKERELRELQERARARLKSHRVNFAQGLEDAREIRRDLDYCEKKTS